ncbi:MAG TPA: 3-deoxy-D-manno-octulosonic acid transferase [Terriglobia bacterium]|nr:3-deoxy-D-manno-octulosonic acid transferase [Terriglobia bacterium]
MGRWPAPPSLDGKPVVWVHAVSLGETKAAEALIRQLRERLPGVGVIWTSSTRTGYAEARRQASPEDVALYPPADYPWVCRRFLRRWKPALVVVMETELWPNLFREIKRVGAGLVLANGRISDRSWPRYRRTRFFWKRVLQYPDAIYAQSPLDAERFLALGAAPGRVRLGGNLKFALRPSSNPLSEALAAAAGGVGPVLVAGSTMPGEETHLLEAFLGLRPDFPALWMILAPRHPERAPEIAAQVRAAGIACQRRSAWVPGQPVVPGVFLLDSAGELAALYQLADAAFIGGTLVPTGGHNLLEPAYFSCPTVVGPSLENFREIAGAFLRARAVVPVASAEELAAALRRLFLNPEEARRLGQAARTLFETHAGELAPLLDDMEWRLRRAAGAAPQSSPVSQPAAAGLAQGK